MAQSSYAYSSVLLAAVEVASSGTYPSLMYSPSPPYQGMLEVETIACRASFPSTLSPLAMASDRTLTLWYPVMHQFSLAIWLQTGSMP